VKGIKKPEELRQRILNRLNNPKNALYNIQSLKDIFSNHINDELEDFVKLLKMCNKAEELDIDYDLKEKLRYLISDIILHRKNEQ
jgi:predicted HAD superfamily phosphohydrolase